MEEDSLLGRTFKWLLGPTGLGATASAYFLPRPAGFLVAGAILLLFLLLFGGYYLWHRRRGRRQRESFTTALEAHSAAAPRAISAPNERANLDRVRQKFQSGLREFRSRGKDIYKLPWYLIIGESGSGKTEAIRHSGIEFPPGLQDQLQGSGGTVNMDWWFTNLGILLDTAGSMLFNEAPAGASPEWREFLRLLKRARPHCPINGLLLVLSVESLIRDSADTIAQKASRLTQQLDLIQRTLDVRFPVYLVVAKGDLLTGFREFFEDIDDPLLQHQMFGWSNPEPLDTPFRPELVEQYLQGVTARLRRRRLALIRGASGTGQAGDTERFFAWAPQLQQASTPQRRLDQMDALFAFPESLMRLAPRLRRYLETIFAAGEWSAKPVFLRGIYFTSSMREGKALDESIAQTTGLSLDQLPEERTWEKNRAFFLYDLFKEKVFAESGLVTHAANTLRLVRQRQLAFFASGVAALLLLLALTGFAYQSLKQSVFHEAKYWNAGTPGSSQETWSASLLRESPQARFRYEYIGTNPMLGPEKLSLVECHRQLKQLVEKPLVANWLFKPLAWLNVGGVKQRAEAQRLLFEQSVLQPLVDRTRAKMLQADLPPSPTAMRRHGEALLSLMELEADHVNGHENDKAIAGATAAARYLGNFLAYLTEDDTGPDTNLVDILAWTYSRPMLKKNNGVWPPTALLGGTTLASNSAVKIGLVKFQTASLLAQSNITQHLQLVDLLADKLSAYDAAEVAWLTNFDTLDLSETRRLYLEPSKASAEAAWQALEAATNFPAGPVTNLTEQYQRMAVAATNASAWVFTSLVGNLLERPGLGGDAAEFFREIQDFLKQLAGSAADTVWNHYTPRKQAIALVDAHCLAHPANSLQPAFQLRWALYDRARALMEGQLIPLESDLGQGWKRYGELNRLADSSRTNLAAYHGPLHQEVSNLWNRTTADAAQQLKNNYVEDYTKLATQKLQALGQTSWSLETLSEAGGWLTRIQTDLEAGKTNGIPEEKLLLIEQSRDNAIQLILASIGRDLAEHPGFPIRLELQESDLGQGWKRHGELNRLADSSRTNLAAYHGPLHQEVSNLWNRITADAAQRLKTNYVDDYTKLATQKLQALGQTSWSLETLGEAEGWLTRIQTDLEAGKTNGIPEEKLLLIEQARDNAIQLILASIGRDLAEHPGFPVRLELQESDLGQGWKRHGELNRLVDSSRTNLAAYHGPLHQEVSNLWNRITADAAQRLKTNYVDDYTKLATQKLQALGQTSWSLETLGEAEGWLTRIQTDLEAGRTNGIPSGKLLVIEQAMDSTKQMVLVSVDQHLVKNLGFPVRLNSTRTQSLQEMTVLRSRLQALVQELQKPLWTNCASRDALVANCQRYLAIVQALVKEDGSPVEWDLYFVPPTVATDEALRRYFRYLRVTFNGKASELRELSAVEQNLVLATNASADSSVTMAFRRLPNSPEVCGASYEGWGLVGLLRDHAAERLQDGTRWRVQLAPGAPMEPGGKLNFEVVVRRPLPKLEDWKGANR